MEVKLYLKGQFNMMYWKNFLLLIKLLLKLGIPILFIGTFIKLFLTLPSNIFLKIIFSIIYLWFTIGININLIMPLLKAIDRKTH